jgi:hypothetical protein
MFVKYEKKLLHLALLVIGAVIILTSGTMAMYFNHTSLSAMLTTARFELRVNDSSSQTQSLPGITLAPGETRTREIKIDTSRCKTPTTLTVTLSANPSGALPPGLSILLDGVAATGSDTLKAVSRMQNAQEKIITMTVSVSWGDAGTADLSAYKDFSMSYDVSVEAEQAGRS